MNKSIKIDEFTITPSHYDTRNGEYAAGAIVKWIDAKATYESRVDSGKVCTSKEAADRVGLMVAKVMIESGRFRTDN